MQRRFFCDVRGTSDSIRQTFMKIKPDRQTLDHLDNLGLGYVAKRRSRRAIATKYEKELPGVQSLVRSESAKDKDGQSKFVNASPYPFNKGARKVQTIVTAKEWNDVPDFGPVPEVAVLGRSNVGKSTLLNAILGYTPSHVQKAAVSNKPGETTALQFFTLGKHIVTKQPTLVVTDMPGYGFAYMKQAEARRCFFLCSEYLRSRGRRLKRVLLLIDARHGFKQADLTCLEDLVTMTYTDPPEEQPQQDEDDDEDDDDISAWRSRRDSKTTAKAAQLGGESGRVKGKGKDKGGDKVKVQEEAAPTWKLQVVLTKCDLVERSELARRVHLVRQQLGNSDLFPALRGRADSMPVLMLSALEGRGVAELHRELASLVPPSASGNSAPDQ